MHQSQPYENYTNSLYSIFAQSHQEEILEFQEHLNHEFKDPKESPLTEEDIKTFEHLDFFPINKKYKVTAKFQRTRNSIPFKMKTTTDRTPTYEVYGIATFEFEGKEYKLNIYQSHDLRLMPQYAKHLFLPFTDLTNGKEFYGGGRFMDLEIPEGDSIVIDFNKAYNPYCAYNGKYSCPIPPKENDLSIEVKAGVKKYGKH
ncbi:DUF1684 domain-containing protein [Flammeovirgaceae bacterium SG7u.111]|nr:DUF1684 domain-containing protein [Flammeovirgaceae bacterium SG7u.132]WPO36806.1 DUF1684 domain-containing protein [Flammeovirgaceae bacterium SG7u.111]